MSTHDVTHAKGDFSDVAHQIVASNLTQSAHQRTVHVVQVTVSFCHQRIFVFMKIDCSASFLHIARKLSVSVEEEISPFE